MWSCVVKGKLEKLTQGTKAKKNLGLSLKFLFSQRGFSCLWGSFEGDFVSGKVSLVRQMEGLVFLRVQSLEGTTLQLKELWI